MIDACMVLTAAIAHRHETRWREHLNGTVSGPAFDSDANA
jgi:hypothetical protein